jgi:predicted RNase H-like HicB family nuclease
MTKTAVGRVGTPTRGYRVELRYEAEDGSWSALVPELPGCVAVGETPNDAIADLPSVIDLWIATARDAGIPVAEPRPEFVASGKFLLRTPKDLHQALIVRAEYEGVSLNSYCVSLLSAGIGRTLATEVRRAEIPRAALEDMMDQLVGRADLIARVVHTTTGNTWIAGAQGPYETRPAGSEANRFLGRHTDLFELLGREDANSLALAG